MTFKECIEVLADIKCKGTSLDILVILNDYPTVEQVKELYYRFDRVISINMNKSKVR
jgi:cyclopropane fatty-acyl-phospholipid synthase-like methyltransferase